MRILHRQSDSHTTLRKLEAKNKRNKKKNRKNENDSNRKENKLKTS